MDEERNGSALKTSAKLPSPGQGGLRRKLCQPEVLAALLISLLAVWLHLTFLNHAGGLWRDEVNVVNLGGRASLGEMAKDSFPVLMPLLVHGWTALGLGAGDLGLRVLGIMIGLGLLVALWVSALVTSGLPPRLGLALFALNSTIIIYGDSLRAYGLGSLLIVLVLGTTWSFLQKPTAWRALLAGGMAVLSVQALYQNSVLVGAICIGSLAACWRRRAWRLAALIFLIALAAAASLTPYVPLVFSDLQGMAVLRAGFQWARAGANLSRAIGFPLQPYVGIWALLALAIVTQAAVALRRREEASGADLRLFAGVTLAVGLAGFCTFHRFAALPTQPWYFLPIMALAAACFDAGLPLLPRVWRVALFGFAVATALVAFPYARQDSNCRLTNIDLLARQLAAEATPGDYVIVSPWYCGLSFARYYRGPAPWTTLPPLADHTTHRYDLVHEQLQKTNAIQPVLEHMVASLRSGGRVWVVGHMYVPLPGAPPPADLPQAPLKDSGWADGPYLRNWLAKVAYCLRQHSAQIERVPPPEVGQVSANEDLELCKASGWAPAKVSGSPSVAARTPVGRVSIGRED